MAKDLEAHRGRSLVLAGDRQPPVVHLLAHALNDRLGNVGQTVIYTAPLDVRTGRSDAVARANWSRTCSKGRSNVLVILGGNPVYTAPADVPFVRALQKVPLRIHLGCTRRNFVPMPLAPARGALLGGLERCAEPTMAPLDRAAADRAALSRPSAHEVVALLTDRRDARPGDCPGVLAASVG